jgi:hypothetical protein
VLAPFHPGNKTSRKRSSAPSPQDLGNMGDSADAPSMQPEPEVFFDQSQQSNKAGKARRKVSYVQDPIHQKKQKVATRSTRSRLATMA